MRPTVLCCTKSHVILGVLALFQVPWFRSTDITTYIHTTDKAVAVMLFSFVYEQRSVISKISSKYLSIVDIFSHDSRDVSHALKIKSPASKDGSLFTVLELIVNSVCMSNLC